jgi:type II secretory pathway pseudopilin PulG
VKTRLPSNSGGRSPLSARPHPAFPSSQRLAWLVARPLAAFSLIEVMVTVGLLSFIILGLLTMFAQTQKAFRTSMAQTDVLETGRSVMDMLTREIEQARPTRYGDRYFGPVRVLATNFFVETTSDLARPLIQDLPGTAVPALRRTNYQQRFFFFTKVNQDWIGTGYQVVPNDANRLIGTLYRFSITNNSRIGPFTNATTAFLTTPVTNTAYMSRIAEGIVHLRVRLFSASGFPIIADRNGLGFAYVRTNAVLPTASSGYFAYAPVKDAFAITDPRAPDETWGCYFVDDALPADVELELGILEPQLLARYRSIPVATAARQFLSDHVAQVHIFRQRISIRNVDVSVFP